MKKELDPAMHSSRFASSLSRLALLICFLLGLQTCAGLAYASTTAPDWLSAIAAKPASFSYGQASSVILLDEDIIEIGRDGTFTHHIRLVRRVLTADGKEKAVAGLAYNTNTHRIKSFQAWLIRPKGDVLEYGKKDTIDIAAFSAARELYGEGHRQTITATNDAEAGSVFAYEAIYEEHSIFSQETWNFSSEVPVECSRLTLRLADGWTVQSHMFNHEPLEPLASGKNMTWELNQLSPVRREIAGPLPNSLRPWLALDIHPPANATSISRQPLFSWSAISAYFSPKYDAAATPDNDMKAKANALAAGAADLRTRIERLCLFAQKTTYISIDLNAAEGGGWIPQPATKVLKCNYGDCKDKATFLRALLRTQGIDAYPIILHAGSPLHVKPDWPSTEHFNHCILAVKVDESIDGPALLVHPKFGRLVIFDPTDSNVPFGFLPKFDSGGFAIILAGADGELIRLPALTTSKYDQQINLRLYPNGSVEGTLEQHVSGPAAENTRSQFRNQALADFKKEIARLLGKALPSPEVSNVEPIDDFDHATFTLKVSFAANAYGKAMRDTLLIFKPVLFPREPSFALRKMRRTQPVIVDPFELSETTTIKLPSGYAVDELPPPVELKSDYGTYKAVIHPGEGNQLILERLLQIPEMTVPAKEYEALRAFYEKIIQAEQPSVVLKHDLSQPR